VIGVQRLRLKVSGHTREGMVECDKGLRSEGLAPMLRAAPPGPIPKGPNTKALRPRLLPVASSGLLSVLCHASQGTAQARERLTLIFAAAAHSISAPADGGEAKRLQGSAGARLKILD